MSSTRVTSLRALLSQHSLSALIVPSEDAHQSEYVAAQDKRREFISGFSGSAGTVVITTTQALLWTDGRYWDQAVQQLDAGWTLMRTGTAGVPSIGEWLRSNATESVGFDAALTSVSSFRRLSGELQNGPCTLTATHSNLVDLVWSSSDFSHLRPQVVSSPLSVHPISRAGQSVDSKISDVRSQLVSNSCHAMIVSALDSISWLFNLRGFDIPFNPVFFAHALITPTSAVLFVDSDKVTAEVREHLELASVSIRPYSEFTSDIQSLNECHSKVWVDPDTCNVAVHSILKAGTVFERTSPLVLAKAIKNDIELAGVRAAHVRDAAAMCEFMCWLETVASDSNTGLNECSVAAKLLEFRAAQPHFVQPSFETISGFGSNGAIIHYKPHTETAARVDGSNLLLLDSGGQYLDGTTDVTRTVCLGQPSAHQRACFSRVLQGHIALASTVFPHGTSGPVLDILARSSLWRVGLNYNHGTGHGVGAFLNVHEGPHGICSPMRRSAMNEVPLMPGMLVSNEPGYYETGAFGIRIESVLAVQKVSTPHRFGDIDYYGFDTIALVPIQVKMLDFDVLTVSDHQWLNDFHRKCFEAVSPLLSGASLQWLRDNTREL